MPARRFLVLLVVLTTVSCSMRPKYSRHFAIAAFDPPPGYDAPYDEEGLISVTAFVLPGEPQEGTKRTVFDLAAPAQTAFIEEVSKRLDDASTPNDLARALAVPLAVVEGEGADRLEDRTRFRRRFVLSVESLPLPPADRLEWSSATIEIVEGGVQFSSWNKLATEYDTVDLAGLTFAQGSKFTLGAELAAPQVAELTKVEAGVESTRSLTEVLQISRRYRVVSGALTPRRAVLVRQGVPGIDLTGNLVVEVTLDFDGEHEQPGAVHVLRGLRDAVGSPRPGERVEVHVRPVLFPKQPDPVKAFVRLDYVIRRVGKGAETFAEGDDHATYRRRHVVFGHRDADANVVSIPVEVIAAEDLRYRTYRIHDWRTEEYLQIDGGPADPSWRTDLVLSSSAEADELLWWLRSQTGRRLAGHRLFINGAELTPDTDLSRLRWIQVSENEPAP